MINSSGGHDNEDIRDDLVLFPKPPPILLYRRASRKSNWIISGDFVVRSVDLQKENKSRTYLFSN